MAAPILLQLGSLYSYIAHEQTLHIFSILTDEHKTVSFENQITSIAANSKFCLVLLTSGQLLKYDPVADGSVTIDFLGIESNNEKEAKETITHLTCGECVTLACTSANGVYNIPNHTTTLPKHVRIRKVAAGFEHCLLLTTNGDVYSWGGGLRGQLGNGEIVASNDHPCIVEGLAGVKIVDIAAAGWHSGAVSSFGDLYTWGWNNQGQLGLQDAQHHGRVVSQPQLVSFPGDEDVTVEKVHCGIGHTVVEVTTAGSEKDVLIVGWDLENRFDYVRATRTPTFEGFRKLQQPARSEKPNTAVLVGSGANQVYFLHSARNE
uniref:Uncharacterized protein n=1 Tax=Anopheles farauti TaxID=69004 RepID=A0A182QBR2_9DIPT